MIKNLLINGLKKEYTIDESGNLFDIENNRYKKQYINHKGYIVYHLYINGKSKTLLAHRLVLMTFNPVDNMENLQVNHIDGNKKNNNISNLEWCTQSENQRHAFEMGLVSRKGEKNSQCKLKESQIIEIAEMILNGCTLNEICKKYKISKSLASKIRNKKLWKDLLENYNFPKSKYSNQKSLD